MSDLLTDDDAEDPRRKLIDLARLWNDLRTFYLLYFAFLGIFLALTGTWVVLTKPSFTATAVVGAADNSDQPFSETTDGGSLAKSGLGGIARHLGIGGTGNQGDAMFDEYTTLLTSYRLADVLAFKDRLLPDLFPDKWDGAHHRWYPQDDVFHKCIDFVKALLGRPLKPVPDADDLVLFLQRSMTSDTSLDTGYATVTMKAGSPVEAERLLNLVLLEADNIIREDKRRDVAARIAYLNSALEHLTLADQKPELIDILSQQQQEMMMIESDHRYASLMIDPAHAPRKPSSPSPTLDAGLAFLLSWGAWFVAVRFTPEKGKWRTLLERFARRGPDQARFGGGQPASAGTLA